MSQQNHPSYQLLPPAGALQSSAAAGASQEASPWAASKPPEGLGAAGWGWGSYVVYIWLNMVYMWFISLDFLENTEHFE